MNILVSLVTIPFLIGPRLSPVRTDLQGMYDEMSAATLQVTTAAEIDDFHAVLCTPDWVFVDRQGHTHDWRDTRARAIEQLSAPTFNSIVERIQRVTVASGVATTIVKVTTAAKAGKAVAYYRDTWIAMPDGWRQQSRTEIAKPGVLNESIHVFL